MTTFVSRTATIIFAFLLSITCVTSTSHAANPKAGNELGHYCQEVRTKISTVCQNGEALKNNNKKKLASAIQKITCKLGAVEDQATFELVKGELQATLGVKAADISDKLYKHLVAKGIAEGM